MSAVYSTVLSYLRQGSVCSWKKKNPNTLPLHSSTTPMQPMGLWYSVSSNPEPFKDNLLQPWTKHLNSSPKVLKLLLIIIINWSQSLTTQSTSLDGVWNTCHYYVQGDNPCRMLHNFNLNFLYDQEMKWPCNVFCMQDINGKPGNTYKVLFKGATGEILVIDWSLRLCFKVLRGFLGNRKGRGLSPVLTLRYLAQCSLYITANCSSWFLHWIFALGKR